MKSVRWPAAPFPPVRREGWRCSCRYITIALVSPTGKIMTPPFVIFSSSRSGSTTLYRSLNLFPQIRVAFEPAFDDIELSRNAVSDRVKEILSEHSGFKHVFDPMGYPFVDGDDATIVEMERDCALWMELNAVILNYPGTSIVFLRRRDGYERIVSELVGRRTGLWAFAHSEVSADEPDLYKETVSQIALPPLDEDLVLWYVENMPLIQDDLRSAILTNPVMDVWFEDLFGDEVELAERIVRFGEIVKFLQIPASEEVLKSNELSLLLRPSAKLNGARVLERIPNYRELRTKVTVPRGAPDRSAWLEKLDGQSLLSEASASRARTAPRGNATGFAGCRLRAEGGNVAALAFLTDQPDAVRVIIARINNGALFDVQLNVPCLAVESTESYILLFRARADQPRRIGIGVAQAHDPWMNLGWYEEIELSTEWHEFHREFMTLTDDNQTRIHFDMGASAIAVELSGLSFASVKVSEATSNGTPLSPRSK